MNVKIYEERTGQMIFPVIPDKEPEKDENIIDQFNNHIDLYVEKKGKTLRISCHISIQKSPEEIKGYYITSFSKFEDDAFTEFKKESNKALRILDLQRNPDDANNIVFNNIEKLDLDLYLHEDTEIVSHVLESGEYLEYQAGNIDEITIFCKDIIRKIENSKIAISSDVSKLGDINILRTKKHEESLRPNERTRLILDKYRKELIEKKRKEDESIARNKINEGTVLIKEGLTILRSTGYEPKDISEEIDKVVEEISTSKKIKMNIIDKYKGKDKIKNIEKDKPKNVDKVDNRNTYSNNNDNRKKSITTIVIIILVIIAALILYSMFRPTTSDIGSGGTGKSPAPVPTLPPIKNAAIANINTEIGGNNIYQNMYLG